MASYSFRFQLEVLFGACAFLCSGSFSWQKQRGFWQTTLIFFVSVWLALIILQAYKVTVKIKSESSEADVDTSLFKSWAAEGLLSPWAMIPCPNEHPTFHTARWSGTPDSVGETSLPFSVWWQSPSFCCRSVVYTGNECVSEALLSLYHLLWALSFHLFFRALPFICAYTFISLCSKVYYLKCLA